MLFDNQYSLLYCIVRPTEEEEDEKKSSSSSKLFSASSAKAGRKTETVRSNNLVIWDVPKQLKIHLFSDSMLEAGEWIQSIFMEHRFDEAAQRMVYTDANHVINNFGSSVYKEPNDRLLITTYVPDTRKYCLWSCTKFGENLQRLRFLSSHTDWHLDEISQCLRFVEWGNNDVHIQELAWRL